MRDSINLRSPSLHATITARQQWTSIHRHHHYFSSGFSSLSQHTTNPNIALIPVGAALLQPKEKPSEAYNIMTGSLSPLCVCVCTGSPVPLSLLKTNGQINTWLTWVPWGKLMVSVCTYKLRPAGTATFSALDCQFAGIYGKLLSMSSGTMGSCCW